MLRSPRTTHTSILIMPLQPSSHIRLRNHKLDGRKSQESQQIQMPILKMRNPLRPSADSWRSPGRLAFPQHVPRQARGLDWQPFSPHCACPAQEGQASLVAEFWVAYSSLLSTLLLHRSPALNDLVSPVQASSKC